MCSSKCKSSKLALSLQYLQKEMSDEVVFEGAWPGMPKVFKIASFQYLFQYLKKDVRDEVDFLPADKHQSFLQVDTIIFDGHGQAHPMFP